MASFPGRRRPSLALALVVGAVLIGISVWGLQIAIRNSDLDTVVWAWAAVGVFMIMVVLLPMYQAVISRAERQAFRRFPGVQVAQCGYFYDEFGNPQSRSVWYPMCRYKMRLLVVTDRGLIALGGLGSFRQIVWRVSADDLEGAALDYWGPRALTYAYPAVRINTADGRERFFLAARWTRPRTATRIAAGLAVAIRRCKTARL